MFNPYTAFYALVLMIMLVVVLVGLAWAITKERRTWDVLIVGGALLVLWALSYMTIEWVKVMISR